MSAPSAQPLPFRDTSEHYGRVSRLLHWSMAALILWQFLGMGLKLALGKTALVGLFTSSHAQVGTAIFVLLVLRMIWSLANRNRRPAPGAGMLGKAAHLGHQALYALMLVVPLVALLRAYGSERAFVLFGQEVFAAQQPPIGWMVSLGGLLHGELGWLMLALIAGHVVMVGLHEAMWRDGTLSRMLGHSRA